MRKKTSRRTRTAHPLVVILRRKITKKGYPTYEYWAARWTDPDTGKRNELKLDAICPSREARRQWCIAKSKALLKRKAELESGAPTVKRTPLANAISEYEKACEGRLRPKTRVTYGLAIKRFLEWAEAAGVKTTEGITASQLEELRDHLIDIPKHSAVKGGKRGAFRKMAGKRSAHAVNRELRTLKTMFQKWRRLGLLPALDKDAIGDALIRLETPRTQPVYLAPSACRKLLEAALRHDKATFRETRREHSGKLPAGSTPKYKPVAPFVAFLLLTGVRRNEALSLEWRDVDLKAVDHHGNVIGAVNLRPEEVKTSRGRQVSLEVCPSVKTLLATLKLKAGDRATVFDLTVDEAKKTAERLVKNYKAPAFRWKDLRSTCEVYLVNSPTIYGSASIYLAAQQLGHSTEVAQRHYLQAIRGISPEAKTLEQAMRIKDVAAKVIRTAGQPRPADRKPARKMKAL